MRPETAQEQHDDLLCECIKNLKSRRSFEAVMAEFDTGSAMPFTAYDPLERALLDNPGLTRETAEEMARALGF